MADCAYALEHFDVAERLYRQILKSYIGLVPQDEVTYHLALSVVRQSKWDEGKELLEQVIAGWPSGDIAKRAKAKLPSVNEKFFTVQIGAFTNKAMADTALKDLKAKGFAGTLESIDIEGEPAFAVRAGRFSSWKAATEHADKLKIAGFSTYKLP
jgi:cell division septation protein DedD